MKQNIRITLNILVLVCLFSCGKKADRNDIVLLRYDDKELTYEEVISKIPDGISSFDSASLFNNIVDGWIKDVLLSDFAEERLYDIQSIHRKVRDYRNSLIVSEYLNRMKETQTPQIDGLRVKEYYDNHRKELKLEVPLVKGVFLKIDSDSRGKENIKNLLSSEDPEEIDKLEREWLDRALEYNYFRDKWIDWETVAGWIPHRFGNPDDFLEKNNYFETDYGENSYYLQITDYLQSGSEQPFEFASSWITELLTQNDLAVFEKSLVESIVNKSIEDKKLEPVCFNPLTHEFKEIYDKDEKE
ncbi:MAG: hypothetical protein J1F67_01665 [Muribaculaceae bacterium]|nr:hypothetical protein [Muribaculaceae bacterium]